jgi:cephalosporin hydroxylase
MSYFINSRNDLHHVLNKVDAKIGIEIGVQCGEYTEYLLKTTSMFMYGIDPWGKIEGCDDQGNVSDEKHQQNMERTFDRLDSFIRQERCKLIRSLSLDAVENFKNDSVDFIYIDADHSYDHVKADIEAYYPIVRKGGIIAGHDFLNGLYHVNDVEKNIIVQFDVKTAVLEFFMDMDCEVRLTKEDWPSWWAIKE